VGDRLDKLLHYRQSHEHLNQTPKVHVQADTCASDAYPVQSDAGLAKASRSKHLHKDAENEGPLEGRGGGYLEGSEIVMHIQYHGSQPTSCRQTRQEKQCHALVREQWNSLVHKPPNTCTAHADAGSGALGFYLRLTDSVRLCHSWPLSSAFSGSADATIVCRTLPHLALQTDRQPHKARVQGVGPCLRGTQAPRQTDKDRGNAKQCRQRQRQCLATAAVGPCHGSSASLPSSRARGKEKHFKVWLSSRARGKKSTSKCVCPAEREEQKAFQSASVLLAWPQQRRRRSSCRETAPALWWAAGAHAQRPRPRPGDSRPRCCRCWPPTAGGRSGPEAPNTPHSFSRLSFQTACLPEFPAAAPCQALLDSTPAQYFTGPVFVRHRRS
jgi:hypothetical protein